MPGCRRWASSMTTPSAAFAATRSKADTSLSPEPFGAAVVLDLDQPQRFEESVHGERNHPRRALVDLAGELESAGLAGHARRRHGLSLRPATLRSRHRQGGRGTGRAPG